MVMKKIIIISLLAILGFSCKKKTDTCESWNVDQWCEPKRSGVTGCEHVILTANFCDKSHSVGEIENYQEDANAKYFRKFISKN